MSAAADIPTGSLSVNVLIVDDDSINREIFRRALGGICNISERSGGVGTASAIREGRPDLVFLDLMMPIVDGFQVIEELVGSAPELLRRIVVVSAATDQNGVEELRGQGVAGVHERPYAPDEILALFHRYQNCLE
jgi:CheY-like chemotaxis protein